MDVCLTAQFRKVPACRSACKMGKAQLLLVEAGRLLKAPLHRGAPEPLL